MNAWKVIVPTLVIFIAGIVTGVVLDKFAGQQHPNRPPGAMNQQGGNPWLFRNRELLKRMDRELDLTPDQHKHIASDMADSQKRIRFDLQELHLAIAKELTPEQRKKFEALTRPRMGRRSGTNYPAGANTNMASTNTASTNSVATNAPATP